jgi:hypothetical protein
MGTLIHTQLVRNKDWPVCIVQEPQGSETGLLCLNNPSAMHTHMHTHTHTHTHFKKCFLLFLQFESYTLGLKILNIFLLFWWYDALNSVPQACWAGALLSFLLWWFFWDKVLLYVWAFLVFECSGFTSCSGWDDRWYITTPSLFYWYRVSWTFLSGLALNGHSPDLSLPSS